MKNMYSRCEWDDTHFVNGIEVPWRPDFPWIPKQTRSVYRKNIRTTYNTDNLDHYEIEKIIRDVMLCDYAASFELHPNNHPSFTYEYAGHWLAAKDSLLAEKFKSNSGWQGVKRNMHMDYPITQNHGNPEERIFTPVCELIAQKKSKLNPNSPYWFAEDRRKEHINASGN